MSMESWSTKSRRRKPPDVFTHLLTRPLAAITIRQTDNPSLEFPGDVPTLTTFPVIPD